MSDSHLSSLSTKWGNESLQTSLSAPDFEYVADWKTLETGVGVVLVNERTRPVRGAVDDMTTDGEILWIHEDGGSGRRLFTRTEGYKLWRSLRS